MPANNMIRLHPNIILTNNDGISPTHGFMLLGLATGTVMSNEDLWLQTFASIDNKSLNNPGALNIITNIEGEQSGVGAVPDLSSKKLSAEELYGILRKMYTLDPIISYDIESFGPQSYYTALLAAGASPDAAVSSAARKEIIETCVELTNGIFPEDFPQSDIFVSEGVVIPLGKWSDKSGERDIRDVDLAFIANQSGDVNLINKWAMSNLPRRVSGLDPFIARTEVINTLIPDAVINGKAVRVTFTANFLSTLASSVERCGLSARYESGLVINKQYNLTQLTDYLASASLHGSAFGQRAAAGGNGYYTGYTNMGTMRY